MLDKIYNLLSFDFTKLPSILNINLKRARKSDFVKKVAETFGTKVFLLIVGLITSVIVARILGPEGRGLYAIAVTISAFGIQFGNLGLHSSNTFQVAKKRELLSTLAGNSIFVSFVFVGICSFLAWILFKIFPNISPLSDSSLLIMSLVSIPIGVLLLLFQNLLIGINKIRFYNVTETLIRIISVIIIGIIIFINWVSPKNVFACTLIVQFFILIWILYVLIIEAKKIPNLSYNLFKDCIGYGMKAYLACFLGFLIMKSSVFLVNYMLGTEQVGYYSIAISIIDMLYLLPTTTGSLLFPKLAAIEDVQYKWKYTKKVILGIGLLMLITLGTTALLANPIINLLFGTKFLPAAPALIWLTPGIFMLSITSLLSNYIVSEDFPIENVYVFLVGFIANFLLNLILIPSLGIIGASISSTIAYTICLAGILRIAINMKNKHFK